MKVDVVEGDLLDQRVDVIVNAWNRNVLPWWLLLPQGVSGAIKKRAGLEPFKALARLPEMPLGSAVHTGAGRLPFKAIIHVAGIDLLWRASRQSIHDSVVNAVALASTLEVKSIAFPVIGAGSGSFKPEAAEQIMLEAFAPLQSPLAVTVVRFKG